MHRLRNVMIACAIGLAAPIIPTSTFAGGGSPPASGGVGGGSYGGATVAIDHTSPAGHNYSYFDYFPRQMIVHTGDTVTFAKAANPTEPHTVTLLPANTPLTASAFSKLFPPSVGNPAPDSNAKGSLQVDFNPDVPANCGSSVYYPGTGPCNYNGKTVINSGFMVSPPPAQAAHTPIFSVRMNVAPGTYRYFCLVHGPHMSGSIRVVAPSVALPSTASSQASADRQYETGTSNALNYEAHLPSITTSQGGHTVFHVRTGDAYGRVIMDEFIPRVVNAKAGDTVMWTPGFHTVTFPANTGVRAFGLGCNSATHDAPFRGFAGCADLKLIVNPHAFFPSGPPGAPYTGGFSGSGVLVIPRPHPWLVSFPKSGAFSYVCLIHPGMVGTVTAQ